MIDRVHDDAILVPVDEDEQPAEDADLRRGEADSVRLVHQRGHALDEALEVVVERLDLPCLHPEGRVAVLTDPREREQPPRLLLELLLVVVVVIVVVTS